MLTIIRTAIIAALLAILPFAAQAEDTLHQGLKVGDSIPPDFMAIDQNGKARDFHSLADRKGLILLFTRSLDW
jgi:hypothetical protein